MKISKTKLFLAVIISIFFSMGLTGITEAATYNWYFSQSGSDTGGDGSMGDPWASLSKAQAKINEADGDDTVNLFFKRGDTWSMDSTVKRQIHGLTVLYNAPIVNIDAYGSGDRPCMEGGVTDFSTAAEHNQTTGPLRWSRIFEFGRTNCSVSNLEIKDVYGTGVFLNNADYFTLSHCEIHNFGGCALGVKFQYGVENSIAEYNTVHTGQQLWRYGLREAGWGGGISFTASGYGEDSQCKNNIIRYNLIYDIFGEGCQAPGGITEYNVIGDTYSTGIYPSPHDFDAYDTIIRYNFVIMSGNSDYQSPYPIPSIHNGRAAHNGLGLIDENLGGSNVNANIEIYGNIVINRYMGIYAKNSMDTDNPFKSIKIYNNLVIDSLHGNYIIDQPEEFTNGYIYNNSSIFYDRTETTHGGYGTRLPHANWTIDNNHFWTTGGSPTVDDGWMTNYVTTDPKLPGEPSVDWDDQSGPTYFSDIDFDTHLYPPVDSALVSTGKTLGVGYSNTFLTSGTDFSALPETVDFVLAYQSDGGWDIGAIVNSDGEPDSDINDDGEVNLEDFAVLSVWWDDENACSSPGWCGGADFDMSGTVDIYDLAYFAENWLR